MWNCESGIYRNKTIQATMNLLVSGPKYDMAPEAESPTAQQQLLSLCRACNKGKNFDSCCQMKPKRPLKSMLGGGVVSRVIVLGSCGKTG